MGYLSPSEIACAIVESSKKKVKLPFLPMVILGFLAGVYIAFGAQLYTIVTHDLSKYLGCGFSKFLGGSVFSVGLMLVVIAGAELFTGNCLILTGVLTRDVKTREMLISWLIVYFANFVGSVFLAAMIYHSAQWKFNDMGVGAAMISTALAKVNLTFPEAFYRAIACNWLVCLAVVLGMAGKDTVSKIFGIYFPIMAFVASGFEHSVANMCFIPAALFVKGNVVLFNADLARAKDILTWGNFIIKNLIPVTLGNIVGGAIFVGTAYYFAYLKKYSA
ncbi:MAG TPA: formate/nitrite transporter family protein [bacterium]|nr:formate/nitrite transporter family protein [bacterium]HOL35854.1 formate/nitrite transporter family protein [bacterium]HPP09243.1 formate/nitrite transporter family protein [bacterium]